MKDNVARGVGGLIDPKQDNRRCLERIKASQAKAIALLQNAIIPKTFGGSRQSSAPDGTSGRQHAATANNATGIKRLVEQAGALLRSE